MLLHLKNDLPRPSKYLLLLRFGQTVVNPVLLGTPISLAARPGLPHLPQIDNIAHGPARFLVYFLRNASIETILSFLPSGSGASLLKVSGLPGVS